MKHIQKIKLIAVAGCLNVALVFSGAYSSDALAGIKACKLFKNHYVARIPIADLQITMLRNLVARTRDSYRVGYRPNPSSRDIACQRMRPSRARGRRNVCSYRFSMCKMR